MFEDSCDAAYSRSGVSGVCIVLMSAFVDVLATAMKERISGFGLKVGITNGVSLGVTLALHVTVLSVLLWVGFHAPPVPHSSCDQKPRPTKQLKAHNNKNVPNSASH